MHYAIMRLILMIRGYANYDIRGSKKLDGCNFHCAGLCSIIKGSGLSCTNKSIKYVFLFLTFCKRLLTISGIRSKINLIFHVFKILCIRIDSIEKGLLLKICQSFLYQIK
jgi:hypothetical protein